MQKSPCYANYGYHPMNGIKVEAQDVESVKSDGQKNA